MFTVDPNMELDAREMRPELELLVEAICDLLDRGWPTRYSSLSSAADLQYTRMRVVQNTYNSIMWLIAGVEEDQMKKPFVLSTAPLVRTLFEELITLLFLFHDFPALIRRFEQTGYCDLYRAVKHAERFHGDNPEWASYIEELRTQMANLAPKLHLTDDASSNPEKWGKWPTPGKMVGEVIKDFPNSETLNFMEYLVSWLYRPLSNDSHLGLSGLVRRGSYFAGKTLRKEFGDKTDALMNEVYESYRMEMVWTTFTLVLSICSEIENHFEFDRATEIEPLWHILKEHSSLPKEFYDRRYKGLYR